jgi:hypothetical protein
MSMLISMTTYGSARTNLNGLGIYLNANTFAPKKKKGKFATLILEYVVNKANALKSMVLQFVAFLSRISSAIEIITCITKMRSFS